MCKIVLSISQGIGQLNPPEESKQELLIRVREGVTKKLYKLATSNIEKDVEALSKWPRAAIDVCWTEGPCGLHTTEQESAVRGLRVVSDGHLQHFGQEYQTLLLVAGGSGISFTLPIMLDIVRRAYSMEQGISSEP